MTAPTAPAADIRAAVFDIDGTLAMMDKAKGTYTALPGAAAALAACAARGIKVAAYTNGTFFPPAHYYPLLADAGLVLEPGHILTPAAVAAHQLQKLGHRRVMVIGAEGTTIPLREVGIDVVVPGPGAGSVDAVLLAWTRDFGLPALEAAAEAVWAGAPAFATSTAPFFASSKGRMLGVSGALAAGLEHATGTSVTVFGKPSVMGLDIVADLTGVRPGHMVVVGDDPKLEMRMARRAGAFAVGVATGISDRAAFGAFPEDERAHLVLDDLTGFASQPWMAAT